MQAQPAGKPGWRHDQACRRKTCSRGSGAGPAPAGPPRRDAVTREQVARVSSAGIDMGAALAYGRSAGGPVLRELTFHQRAALLKSLGLLLRQHRQELYALSARTGATLGDAKFD